MRRIQINCGPITSLEFTKQGEPFAGETHNLAQWAKILNIHLSTLINRYHAGDRGARLFRPTDRQLRAAYRNVGPDGIRDSYQEIFKLDGVDYSIEEISELYEIPIHIIRRRKERGWSDRQAITQPLSNVVPDDPDEACHPTTLITKKELRGGWMGHKKE